MIRTSRLAHLTLQFVALRPDHPGDVVSRGLAAEGHGAVDGCIDFWSCASEQIAAEAARHLNDDLCIAAA